MMKIGKAVIYMLVTGILGSIFGYFLALNSQPASRKDVEQMYQLLRETEAQLDECRKQK